MQIRRIAIFFILLIFCAISIEVSAQEEEQTDEKPARVIKEPKPVKRVIDPSVPKPYRSWSISVVPFLSTSFTDIKKNDFFGATEPRNENQIGVSAHVIKMLSGAFGIMGRFYYSKIVGVVDDEGISDEDRIYLVDLGLTQPVYFDQTTIQGSFNLYWNISNTIFNMNKQYRADRFGQIKKKRWISVYTYGGVGLARYDEPKLLVEATEQPLGPTYLNPTNVDAAYIVNGSEKFTELILPVGLGVKFKITHWLDLGLEGSASFAMTDKLDGLVYDHPNRSKNDKYASLGLNVTYKIGTKNRNKEHMEWVNPTEEIAEQISSLDRKMDRIAKDSDNDGVSDAFDKDPNTAEGVVVDGSGVPLDVDRDGIPDDIDEELFSDKQAIVDEFGVSMDADQDGVPDHRDREPNTAKDAFVNFEGMTIVENLGIDVDEQYRNYLLPSVYFDFNRTNIKEEYETRLFEVARLLKENKGLKVLVVGNTDETGSEAYNEGLSNRRAESVINYLVEQYGIPASSFEAVSKGEKDPQSRKNKLNRRVDFIVTD